jgi:DNA-binding response OmpR family regulator
MKINAVLKRNNNHKPKMNFDKDEYEIGSFHFIFSERILSHSENDEKRILSPKESQLLKMLCDYQDSVLSREHALNTIWGNDGYYTTRSMDVYLTKLRKYLSADEKIHIINIHGSGYVLKIK